MQANILADFQICISVPLMIQRNYYAHLQKKISNGLLNQSIEIDILQSE